MFIYLFIFSLNFKYLLLKIFLFLYIYNTFVKNFVCCYNFSFINILLNFLFFRWDVDKYFDPDPATDGKMYTKEGGFIDGIEMFDADFFKISNVDVSF